MRKILLLALVFVTSATAFGQDYSNKGKDFWIPYPEHIDGTTSAMGLYITSDLASTGTVTVGASTVPFTITPNSINPIFLGPGASGSAPNTGVYLGGFQDNVISGKGIHVVATNPVVVFAHIIKSARSGATLVLPTTVWGKEYIVPSFANSGASTSIPSFDVFAEKPNTVIEITPSITSRNGARTAGVPYQVTLNNVGDVYQLQFPNNQDPSGTTITSIASGTSGCNKIAVFSATSWSGINCGGASGGDNFYQQLFPSASWGKEFFTGPLKKVATAAGDNNIDIIRVYVKDPSTTVTKMDNGIVTTLAPYNAIGKYYQYTAFRPTYIQADKPIQVMQFITSQTCGSPQTNSDPEMIALSSVEQTISDITVFSAYQGSVPPGQSQVTTHYINVIMKSAFTGQLTINGLAPTQPFTAIAGTAYSYLKQPVTTWAAPGPVFRLKADSGFSAIAYGFGNVESYGYNAGTYVRDLNTKLEILNPNTSPTESEPSACTNSPFRFKVYFQDSTNSLSPIRYDSIQWEVLNNAANFTPNNFPVMTRPISPSTIVEPDSVNLRNGKYVAWYSIPGLYYVNTPGVYQLRITLYRSSTEGCGNSIEYPFDLTVSNPPSASFTVQTPGCYLEPVRVDETTPQIPKTTYKQWWEFYDPVANLTTVYSNMVSGAPIRFVIHPFTTPGTKQIRHVSITTPGCISDTIVQTVTLPDIPNATAAGNTTVCINTGTVPVTFNGTLGTAEYIFSYTIDNGSGPGPVLTTLPSSGGIFTINAPTNVAGTFIYNLVGVANASPVGTPCIRVITGQSVTVNILPDHAIALGTGNPSPTVCVNNAITPFTLTLSGGATNIAAPAGLPAGVTAIVVGNTVTISGTPTLAGTYPYTITTSGNACLIATYTGTITVNADHTISLIRLFVLIQQLLPLRLFLPEELPA
jgi:hypothetical protein